MHYNSFPRRMKISKLFYLLVLFILSQKQVLADKKSYIVYLGGHSHGPEIISADLHRVTNSHVDFLTSFLGSKKKAKDVMFYSYQRHINGFAAILEEEEAANIAKHPDVVSVFPNRLKKLHTSHSWDFLGLENVSGGISSSSLWNKSNFGENIIIAHIDSGVWPESESFDDSGYGSVPKKWKGLCVNDTKSGVPCNRKLIGARYFIKGYIAIGGDDVPANMQTPRDHQGHGTHTLSTAAGNFVNASILGAQVGMIKGGSPKARVAMYKACWPMGCADADVLQSFDYAIDDGADVISVSLGGGALEYYADSISIGSFHALKKNIVVSASAGNGGSPATVINAAPWIITVGASTIDRTFSSAALLSNGLKLEGESISKSMAEKKYYPLIYAGYAKAANSSNSSASHCEPGSLDPKKVRGKILVCLRRDKERTDKSIVAGNAGAVGIILCNTPYDGDSLHPDVHIISAVQISYNNSVLLFKYMNSTSRPTAYITPTYSKFGVKPSPTMASFSSTGPNVITPDILKPDVTAPGVHILASYSPDATDLYGKADFNILSGTSMSCPHVAGAVGLLKKLHPDWSPAAIRSALMTTAQSRDNTDHPMTKDVHYKATPFDYGAGHIQPNRAADPGLVYDLTVEDYLNFLCAVGYNQQQIKLVSGGSYVCPENASVHSFNYPSITVFNITAAAAAEGGKVVTVSRTLKNVGAPATYSARIRSPDGFSVTVDPEILRFEKIGDERSFKLTLEANGTLTSYVSANLIWSDGRRHYVRTQIVVGPGKEKAKDVMIYSYQRHINGFAAILEEEEAANIIL